VRVVDKYGDFGSLTAPIPVAALMDDMPTLSRWIGQIR
jgi:hypothetical protein